MHGGQRQFARVEAPKGVAAVAVEDGLQVDLADALQRTDEESVDRDELSRVMHLDLAFPEFRTEAFQQPDLLFAERQRLIPLLPLEA